MALLLPPPSPSSVSLSSSSSFSSKPIQFSFSMNRVLYVLFLILLLVGSSAAARPGATMDVVEGERFSKTTAFQYRGQLFNFLPKGAPIPPSGPSKRHNGVVDSNPRN